MPNGKRKKKCHLFQHTLLVYGILKLRSKLHYISMVVDIPILDGKPGYKQEGIRNYKTFFHEDHSFPEAENNSKEDKTRQSDKPLCNERRLCRVAFLPIHDVVWND